jgi:hypothetical protein
LLGGGLKDAGWQREHMSQNRLAILPNLTHYEMGLAPQLVDTALPFLNGQGRAQELGRADLLSQGLPARPKGMSSFFRGGGNVSGNSPLL